MKQHLSPNDLDKLPERIQDILTDYAIEWGYHQSGLEQHEWWTIGRLFEYLASHPQFVPGTHYPSIEPSEDGETKGWGVGAFQLTVGREYGLVGLFCPELCDALFQAVIEQVKGVSVD